MISLIKDCRTGIYSVLDGYPALVDVNLEMHVGEIKDSTVPVGTGLRMAIDNMASLRTTRSH